MQISKIGYRYSYNSTTGTKQHHPKQIYCTNPAFEGVRSSKEMPRFDFKNGGRMPTTLQLYLDGLSDRYSIKPAQAMKNAYAKLVEAKTIEDVQKYFPDEERFIYLQKANDTKEDRGLLGIIKEFNELYDSVLKNGEDLTLYIVRKIFYDSEILRNINADLENDLHDDIKAEFKRKCPKAVYKDTNATKYLTYEDIKSLGIYYPDQHFFNSLQYTKDGYSDWVGAIISEKLRLKIENMTEEEKFEAMNKNGKIREHWWNTISHEKRLEYAAGVESGEELYKDYKRYLNAEKRRLKNEAQQENKPVTEINEETAPSKTKTGGSKLSDKEIFVYWMQKNLEKFYEGLSEADKDSVHIKRVRKLVLRWQEMTPEEKSELILKMKAGREPGRIIMIDAWNHSTELIKELSKFLKSKQILKPVDVFFESEEFKSFQSKIMTEFWAEHADLAEEFGNNIHNAYLKVEDAMNRGVFQDLKAEVLRDQKYRKKLIERERLQEEAAVRKAEAEARRLEEWKANPNSYKYEFIDEYNKKINPIGALPVNYLKDVTEAMLEMYPKEIIQEYTEALKNNSTISDETYEKMSKIKETKKFIRSQRAIEMALADEFASKWSSFRVYGNKTELLFPMLATRVSQDKAGEFSNKEKIDLKRIETRYNEYRKDLRETEIRNILQNYFIINENVEEKNCDQAVNDLAEYISAYGRSILPLFDGASIVPIEQKIEMNEKFLNMMPENLKNYVEPLFKNADDVTKFSKIHFVNMLFNAKYKFLPQEIKDIYLRELDVQLLNSDNKFEINGELTHVADIVAQGMMYETGAGHILRVIKKNMPLDDKIKMLAIEQAMADELVNLSKYNVLKVNSYEFEDLCKISDRILAQIVEKNNSYVQYNDQMFVLSRAFNYHNVIKKYNAFIKEFREIKSELKDGQNMTTEDILFTLNPDEKNELKDKYVAERMEKYGFV